MSFYHLGLPSLCIRYPGGIMSVILCQDKSGGGGGGGGMQLQHTDIARRNDT